LTPGLREVTWAQALGQGDFTTAQRRSFRRERGGFRCSYCGRLTPDPIAHGAEGTCFQHHPVCEIAVCQRPIHAGEGLLFGMAGAATREAHAVCYLPAQGPDIQWLW